MSATKNVTEHFDDASSWTASEVVKHLENDHGAVPDWDEPWEHHRKCHWRDTEALDAANAGDSK